MTATPTPTPPPAIRFSVDTPGVSLATNLVTDWLTGQPSPLIHFGGASILFNAAATTGTATISANILNTTPPPASLGVQNIVRAYFPIQTDNPLNVPGSIAASGIYMTVHNIRLVAQIFFERYYNVSLCTGGLGPNGRTMAKPVYRAQGRIAIKYDLRLEHETKKSVGGTWQPDSIKVDPDSPDIQVAGESGDYLFLQGVTLGCMEPAAGEHYDWMQIGETDFTYPLTAKIPSSPPPAGSPSPTPTVPPPKP